MSAPQDGGPAFPVPDSYDPNGQCQYGSNGMSLRDYFAGQALAGWLASFGEEAPHPVYEDTVDSVAKHAYATADAMLRARGGQP